MLPLRLALAVAGDLARGFTIVLRLRALWLLRVTRVLRMPQASAAPAAGTTTTTTTTSTTPEANAAPPPAAASAPVPPAAPREAPEQHSRARARLPALAARLRLAERLLRSGAVRIERPRGWLAFALADPGETGRAFGLACALAPLADPHGAIEVRPLWTETDELRADLSVEARVVPLRVLIELARARLAERRTSGSAPPAATAQMTDAA